MKYITYLHNNKESVGFLNESDNAVYPLPFADMNALIEAPKEKLEVAIKEAKNKILLSDVTLLAPIPRPKQDVICLGINYKAHADEAERYSDAFKKERPIPIYFSKRVNRATAPGEGIPSHQDIVKDLDYEAELAVIIGREASHVPASQVKDYIFGYTIINDVSARTLQTQHKQWYFGKGLDGFLPMGPCIATVDELQYPPHVQIQSRVNGELRQDSNTRLLIFDIDHIVSELSQGMTLKAGTIIATGTPAGVGMGFNPPRFLKPGDVVECTIEGIGTIANKVMD